MLAAVILMAILLISLLAYAIYQRFRGPCHACSVNKRAVKVITKDMVKARESKEESGPVPEDLPDLERGESGLGNWEYEREKARKEALDALTRPESVLVKPTMWERALGFVGSKNKDPEPEPEAERKTSASNDRFFTVDPVTHVFRGLVSIAGMILLRHPYCQICTTLAPRPPAEIFLQRSRSEQSEHYTPGPVLSTSPPAHSEPFNYSAYLRNDWKSDKSAVPGVLTVRNAKRRSRTYGGLPVNS
jgi:hypothetical protein